MKRNTVNETQETETAANLFSSETQNNVLDFSTTLKELRKTVDPYLIRQRAGRRDRDGNVHMVEYVEWHTVADVLDDKAPNWGHTVKDIRSIGEIITVTVAITIDGITREGVGTGEEAVLAAARGAQVTCVDISRQMLDRLARRLAKQNLSAEILCQNAFDHVRVGHYDACSANYFLNVFRQDDMLKMLSHSAGLVRKGGKLMIADVALPQGGPFARAFNLAYLKTAMATFWTLGLVPWHPNYDYAIYFQEAGLTLDHVRHFPIFRGGPIVFQTTVGVKAA